MIVAPFAFFTILAVVTGLCALIGNTRPVLAAFWAAASALIPFIALGFMQGGGLAAYIIFLFLLAVIPSSVFLLALARLHQQNAGQAIRPALRTALALCCLFSCYGAYAIGLADSNKERSFAVAIMSNDADKFNRTLRAGPLSFQRGLLQEAPEATRLNLLRRLELPENWEPENFDFVWDIILSLPPSADRTELVKRFAAIKEMPAPIWVLIAFHDQGAGEDEEIIWNKGRDLDEFIHYSFRRLDLLEEALKRASDDEIRELARYGSSALSRLASDWPDGALAVAKAKLRLAQREGAPLELPPDVLSGTSDPRLLSLLIKHGADVNAGVGDHSNQLGILCYSPAHYQLARGSDGTALALLKAGADIKAVDSCGRGLLHYAAAFGRKEKSLRFLLAQGLDPSLQDAVRLSPLHLAAWRGDAETAADLLKAGAHPDPLDDQGLTPLFLAVKIGGPPMLEMLISRAGEEAPALLRLKNNEGRTPLLLALAQPKYWDALLQQSREMGIPGVALGLDPSWQSYGPLPGAEQRYEAFQAGRLACALHLLEAGADIKRLDKEGNGIFHQLFFVAGADTRELRRGRDCRAEECNWRLVEDGDREHPTPDSDTEEALGRQFKAMLYRLLQEAPGDELPADPAQAQRLCGQKNSRLRSNCEDTLRELLPEFVPAGQER